MRQSILFLLLAWTSNVHAQNIASPLPFYCDQATGTFFVGWDSEETPSPDLPLKKESVDWIGLLKLGPKKNRGGDPFRSGSRVSKYRCGPFAIRFSSGFLNANVQGELGALDFPVVEVRSGGKILLPRTALDACSMSISLYQAFGQCPDAWARSIEITHDQLGHRSVKIKRSFTDEQGNDVERIDVHPVQHP